MDHVDIVFDGLPGHFGPRFVEVEIAGRSVHVGDWIKREDGLYSLRITKQEIENAEEKLK